MAGRSYNRGDLFRRNQLAKFNNGEENNDADEDVDIESDLDSNTTTNLDQFEVFSPESESTSKATTTTSKANVRPTKSAKKVAKKTPKNRPWTPERIELLLKYMKEYKVTCDFNGKDFEHDLSSMYTEIRRCLSLDYPEEFGPETPSQPEIPLADMTSDEYKEYKAQLNGEQERIKKGYDRAKEKIRNLRQDFRAAVNKGTRSGSGKIVQENYHLLCEIWGGSPATTSLPFGIDGGTIEDVDDDEISETYDGGKLNDKAL